MPCLGTSSEIREAQEGVEVEDLALPKMRQWLADAKKDLGLVGDFLGEEPPALLLDVPPLSDVRGLLSKD
jgi:hypothetical protein